MPTETHTKLFLFKDLQVNGAKVSHHFMVGLPSLTGLTGLATAFGAKVAQSLDCDPLDVKSSVLCAIDNYQLHEGFKKGFNGKGPDLKAVPAAWASFNAHLVIELTTTSQQLGEAFDGVDLNDIAVDVLQSLTLCKGSIQNVRKPVNLEAPRLKDKFPNVKERALAMIPAQSLVITETSVVSAMRSEQLPLMQGLVAASLPAYRRPKKYQQFFEDYEIDAWKLVPVQDGYLVIDQDGAGTSTRKNFRGEQGPSYVASPTLTLVRLQKAASLRVQQLSAAKAGEAERTPLPFWSLQSTQEQFFCTTYKPPQQAA
jgi:hypothetical protein